MRIGNRLVLIVATAILASGQAFGEGLTVTLNNGTTNSLLVTVYDLNVNPPRMILSSLEINGNASITISLAADMWGHGHLQWAATTVDRTMRQCGHGDSWELDDGDSVSVNADSDCPGR